MRRKTDRDRATGGGKARLGRWTTCRRGDIARLNLRCPRDQQADRRLERAADSYRRAGKAKGDTVLMLEKRFDRQPCCAGILYECMRFLVGHS